MRTETPPEGSTEQAPKRRAAMVKNFIYNEGSLGQSAQLVRTLTLDDIRAFAAVSGDTNPANLDPVYADAPACSMAS